MEAPGGIEMLKAIGLPEEGREMRKRILISLILTIFLLSPNLATADCVDLENFTSWVRVDEHTIIFYMGEAPVARVNIPYCEIAPSSTIRLSKSYVCDSDSIVVDGKTCSIMTVKVLY
jgi:hypothetical protein